MFFNDKKVKILLLFLVSVLSVEIFTFVTKAEDIDITVIFPTNTPQTKVGPLAISASSLGTRSDSVILDPNGCIVFGGNESYSCNPGSLNKRVVYDSNKLSIIIPQSEGKGDMKMTINSDGNVELVGAPAISNNSCYWVDTGETILKNSDEGKNLGVLKLKCDTNDAEVNCKSYEDSDYFLDLLSKPKNGYYGYDLYLKGFVNYGAVYAYRKFIYECSESVVNPIVISADKIFLNNLYIPTPGEMCGLANNSQGPSIFDCSGYNPYEKCPEGYEQVKWGADVFGRGEGKNDLVTCFRSSSQSNK